MKAFTLMELLVILIIIGIVLLLGFAGCLAWNTSHVKEGIVVERYFVPEHTETNTTYHKIGNVQVPITNTYIIPDTYTIGIEGKYKDKVYVRSIHVDKISYQMLRVGDYLKIEDLPLIPKAEMEQ